MEIIRDPHVVGENLAGTAQFVMNGSTKSLLTMLLIKLFYNSF